jgi:hypothetical protein
MKHRLLWLTFGLIALTGALHFVGSVFYLYWGSFWFDGLMHFLGGVVVGLLFLWIWFASGVFEKSFPTKREAMAAAVVFAMIVGIGWEVFEYVYGIAMQDGLNYPADTFHDIAFDFLGAITAGFLGRAKGMYE